MPKSKLFSDLEFKCEVDAEKRMKRKAATQCDSSAATARRRKQPKPADAKDTNTKRRAASTAKQSIKKVREKRKIQRSKESENPEDEGRVLVAVDGNGAAPEDFFWEVEAVIGRRKHRGRVEYLIRWKGCSDDGNTWEPAANLCDTAMEEAVKYTKALKLKQMQREENERKLFGQPDQSNERDRKENDAEDIVIIDDDDDEPIVDNTICNNDHRTAMDSDASVVVDDTLWKWADKDQVVFRDVERINVNDPNAAKLVTEARIVGTPLVLVGHVGWANFAKRWLKEKKVISEPNNDIHSWTQPDNPRAGGDAMNPESGVAPGILTEGVEVNSSSADIANEVAQVLSELVAKVDVSMGGEIEGQVTDPTENSNVTTIASDEKCTAKINHSVFDDLLDLSKSYELDIEKMIKDIGEEDVPIIKRHYNEEKPIHAKISAEKFLRTCWPSTSSETLPHHQQQEKTTKIQKPSANFYLHQWQFPLSDTAGRKLCHKNNPLPKGIMGEDLLKYWLDLSQCKFDSPLQYIFMGREDTLSKLHKDPGGLEISIAPIVGQKECVLVHRDDGSNCLYHLTASLEEMDLQRYPLLSQARLWRTVIQPGEILLMPYATYHQCRNITPCLSYSRFHLDHVNLHPFVQSLIDKDAPEIDHEEVLWNLTSELIKRVDGVFDKVQERVKEGNDEGDLISDDVTDSVNLLRTLRHFVREVARRKEINQIVKGSEVNPNEHNFEMLVDDIDMCLHEFRYRRSTTIPPFKPRRVKALKNLVITAAKGGRCKDVIKRDMSKFLIGNKPVVAFNSSLENNYTSLVNADVAKHFPNAEEECVGEGLIGQLAPGDKIFVRLEQKFVKAEVIEITKQTKSAYISYEDYPSVYDEYHPVEFLRLTTRAEIPDSDLKPGLLVIDLSNSNEYRGRILSILNSVMARVKLVVSQHEMTRLISPAMILGRYTPFQKRSKNTIERESVDPTTSEPEVIMPPTKVGQIVEVYWRGAARVTKLYGDPVPTHVDVRFLLGMAHDEYMVPIKNVRLAPELDPDSGRCRRQLSKQGPAKPSSQSSVSQNDGTPQSDSTSSPFSDGSVIEISE